MCFGSLEGGWCPNAVQCSVEREMSSKHLLEFYASKNKFSPQLSLHAFFYWKIKKKKKKNTVNSMNIPLLPQLPENPE